VAEGVTFKSQNEEELVGCSFSAGCFARQKDVKREEKNIEGYFPQ